MLHEKVGKHGMRHRDRYQVAQNLLNRLCDGTCPKHGGIMHLAPICSKVNQRQTLSLIVNTE